MKRILLISAILAAMLLSACAAPATPSEPTNTPTPTTTPTEPSTPKPAPEPKSEPTTSEASPTIAVEELKVHFIDVGQGDSILIDLGSTEILIDGGGRSPGIVPYLRSYVDGAIEVMVATHPHADHIGGLIEVLAAFEVNEIWHNGGESDSKTYAEFMGAVESEGTTVNVAKLHDIIQAGELSLYIHNPADLEGSTNNDSIVLHLAYGKIDFLFTGDAEKEAEGNMMALSSIPVPRIEILKVGHHGSKTASSKDFLAVTSPEVAIYMAKEGNSYGHPHQETIDALNEIGTIIYGTDVNGTITLVTDGETFSTQTER